MSTNRVTLSLQTLETRETPSTIQVMSTGESLAQVVSNGGGVNRLRHDRGWERLTSAPGGVAAVADTGSVAVSLVDGVNRFIDGVGWQGLTAAVPNLIDIDRSNRVVAAFPGAGLWLYSGSAWTKISNANPDDVAIDAQGGIAAAFGSGGVWRYSFNTGWTKLSSSVAQTVDIDTRGRVAAAFVNAGLWLQTPSTGWAKIGEGTPDVISLDSTGGVAAGYGAGGVWRIRTTWQKLSDGWPSDLDIDPSGRVAARFGQADNWLYGDLGWQQISPSVGGRTRFETSDAIVTIPAGVRTLGQRSPILVAFNPNGDAAYTTNTFVAPAQTYGFILYADKYYRNNHPDLSSGLSAPGYAIMKGKLDAAFSLYPVDTSRVILTGMSGGGSFAHAMNLSYPGLADALVINTGMVWGQTIPEGSYNGPDWTQYGYDNASNLRRQYASNSRRLVVFLASPTDFRYEEMQRDSDLYGNNLGWGVYWTEFAGGHVTAPPTKYTEAFDWITTRAVWVN